MCLFTSSTTVTVKFSLYIMDLMIKVNHEQYDTVPGAVDFRGRRPSKDGMPVEGVDCDKILALLPLKMLISCNLFLPNKGFIHLHHYNFTEMQELKLFQDKEIFLVKVVLSLYKGFLPLILLFTYYVGLYLWSMIVYYCCVILSSFSPLFIFK